MEEVSKTPLEARRDEVAQYDHNITVLTAILATLPSEWPEDLTEWRNPKNQHTAIDNVPDDRVEDVSRLWLADETRHRIKTEMVERSKAAAILAVEESLAGELGE